MSTPRSGRSTANHSPTEHPDDALARETLRLELVKARRTTGLDSQAVSRSVNRHADWIYEMENVQSSSFWLFNSLHLWGVGVGLSVGVYPVLNPVLQDAHIGPLARAGVRHMAYSAIGFLEYLKTWREVNGITQREVADSLGVVHKTMYSIEDSDNPRISTLQKYARALGGSLEFQIEPIAPLPPRKILFDDLT